MDNEDLEYLGFWPRLGASLIDMLIQLVVTAPLTYAVYGRLFSEQAHFMGTADVLINLVLPFVAVVALWLRYGATPGKMVMSARIVDADTGAPLTPGACVIRYLGYLVSALPLCVGFLWIAFDRRKQGWHDKMANSVVVRPAGGVDKVQFKSGTDWRVGAGQPVEPRF